MSTWNELMKGRCFISDLGADQTTEINGQSTVVGRYAVWSPLRGSDGHQVIEVGQELEPLMKKYHIPIDRVCRLSRIQQEG